MSAKRKNDLSKKSKRAIARQLKRTARSLSRAHRDAEQAQQNLDKAQAAFMAALHTFGEEVGVEEVRKLFDDEEAKLFEGADHG